MTYSQYMYCTSIIWSVSVRCWATITFLQYSMSESIEFNSSYCVFFYLNRQIVESASGSCGHNFFKGCKWTAARSQFLPAGSQQYLIHLLWAVIRELHGPLSTKHYEIVVFCSCLLFFLLVGESFNKYCHAVCVCEHAFNVAKWPN